MAGIKDRLIQFILRGKDELSPEAKKSAEALATVSAEAEELGKALDSAKDARGLAKGLESTQRAATQAERSLVQTDLQIKELRDALTAAPESAGLQQSLKDAERESRRAQKALDDLQAKLSDQEKAAKAAGIDTSNLASEEKRLAAEVDNAKQALASNAEQLKALKREHAAAARAAAEHTSRLDGARQAMSGGVKSALAFAAAYVSLNAVFDLVGRGIGLVRSGIVSMLQTGDQFEGLQIRMNALMGSVAGGEQATQWIKDFAKSTPLQLNDVTEAFAQLKAYGIDPMDGTMQALVDQNEKMGGGMERLLGISSAVGQAYAKQKLQTEEILQLIERGVPAWDLLAKVTGKNASQLSKLATEGKLGRDVLKALVAEIGKTSAGAAEANMSRLSGLISNLKDQAADFLDRIAKAGALDYVKGKLKDLGETITAMDKDGRLDALAKSLSNAFTQGSEKVQAFAQRLLEVDFNQLIDNGSAWLSNFGAKIDDAATRVQLFIAPFRTLFNGITAGFATIGLLASQFAAGLAKPFLASAEAIADAFNLEGLKAKIQGARQGISDFQSALVEQIEQDSKDIASAWDTTSESAEASAKRQTDAVKGASEQQRLLGQAQADQFISDQKKMKDAAVDAAVTGQAAITDMGNALQLINTASTVQQLEGLRGALLKAYEDGNLSQTEYTQATGVLSGKLRDLGKAASSAGDTVSDLSDKLGDLKSVQAAISNAKTDVDINNIKAALRKLYNDGQISARDYNEELKKTSARQTELKVATQQGAQAQADKNQVDKEAITTSEQLRRESGRRMEDERRAGDQAMQDRRKGAEEAQHDMGAMEDFFGGVMSRAREPLAAMSAAALEAFDKLQGISTVDLSMDTSGLKETTASLEKATDALGQMQAAANTVGMSGLGIWMTTTALRSQQLQVRFLEQKAALQQLMEGYESGSVTLGDFVEQGKAARNGMNLLNDSDLRSLEGALDAARQKMQQLEEGSKATLSSLREELDGLLGDQAAVERSKFASRRADIQTQLAQAQAGGDLNAVSNLMQALSTLKQIEEQTAQKRQAEDQQKRIDAQKAAQPAASAPAPAKVIQLQVKGGQAVSVGLQNENDETNLLSILEHAGLRTL